MSEHEDTPAPAPVVQRTKEQLAQDAHNLRVVLDVAVESGDMSGAVSTILNLQTWKKWHMYWGKPDANPSRDDIATALIDSLVMWMSDRHPNSPASMNTYAAVYLVCGDATAVTLQG